MELAAAGEDLKKLREIARVHIEKAAAGDMQPTLPKSRRSAAMDTVIKKLRTSPVFEPLLQPMRLVGCWTGSSAGFAPLRVLPT